MPTARFRLNAFDKNSSGSFSRTIEVDSVEDFLKQQASFDKSVPFSRFYCEHECLDGDDGLIGQVEEHELFE
jgi:hypothetical protein